MNIQLLNPKAKKLLKYLEDLNLIKIQENSLLDVVRHFRKKKAKISRAEILKEVETVRKNRHGK